eukprot:TRINITY_DN55008_c0_g1_i1.p1 TRINITY_DN55008_c0_g1~~TRINITY_DN55008_c0_g1_i1.p1  ORF type:complete len:581 (+),score=138.88 TRINITY_DN55008_c0_g1_i1:106-1848(+)
MIRRPPRSTLSSSSAASDVYKRQVSTQSTGSARSCMNRLTRLDTMSLVLALLLLLLPVKADTGHCPAGETCPAITAAPPCPPGQICLGEAPSPQSRTELKAIDQEIAELSKLIQATTAKLKAMERMRRLAFPAEYLHDARMEDDFVPTRFPLLKDVPLEGWDGQLVAAKILEAPLIAPPKKSPARLKLMGACLMLVSRGSLHFYNALGQHIKSVELQLEPTNQVVAVAAKSDGKHAVVAAGTTNGTILFWGVHHQKNKTSKMDFRIDPMAPDLVADEELHKALESPVTCLAMQMVRKNVVTYAGDASGRIRAVSAKGKLMRLVETTNLTAAMPAVPEFMPALGVSGVHCCVDKNLVVTVGRVVGLLDTKTLQLSVCHVAEEDVTGVAVGTGPLKIVYATAGTQLLTLRTPKKKLSAALGKEPVCKLIYTSRVRGEGAQGVFTLKNYLLLNSQGAGLVVYNASKLKEAAPWPVLDVPLNLSSLALPGAQLLLSSDGQASFVVGQLGGGPPVLWHTDLPQQHESSSWEMPSRTLVISAAVLLVFGYKALTRNKRKDGDEDLHGTGGWNKRCLLYTSPSPRDS